MQVVVAPTTHVSAFRRGKFTQCRVQLPVKTTRQSVTGQFVSRQSLCRSRDLAQVVCHGASMSALENPTSMDLLIVGPGVLGSYLGKLWKDKNPAATVTGQTNTTNNHEMCALYFFLSTFFCFCTAFDTGIRKEPRAHISSIMSGTLSQECGLNS